MYIVGSSTVSADRKIDNSVLTLSDAHSTDEQRHSHASLLEGCVLTCADIGYFETRI